MSLPSRIGLIAGLSLLSVGALAQGRMIAIDSARALFEIDIATGTKTQIGTVSANAGTTAGLAYDRVTNTMYLTSTSTDSLYTLNLDTFEATLVGPYGDSTVVMHGLEWDSSTNSLYGGTSERFFSIDPGTGAATLIGNTGLTSFTNLGYNSATDVMYATNSSTDSLYTVNRATGQLTLIGALNGPTNPNGLAFNHDNGLMYMIDNSTDTLYSLDLATGAANAIGSMGSGNLLGLAYVNPVPEPATLAALGLGGLALLRRRRKSA